MPEIWGASKENEKQEDFQNYDYRHQKNHKTTTIYTDESDRLYHIQTYNTDLKNRLSAYAGKYPELCRQTDDDGFGGLSFEIDKRRFSFRLTVPYSEERRQEARHGMEAMNGRKTSR